MTTMHAQRYRVLEFMRRTGSITQEDCDRMYPKIKRLAARIHNLKEIGYTFTTRTIKTPGGAHVAEYRIKATPGTGRRG